MRASWVRSALVIASATMLTTSAYAQDSRRPNRALFESGAGKSEQELTANGSIGAGYDTNARIGASEAGLFGPLGPATDSGYSVLSGGLSYSVGKPRFRMGANANASRRYYY